MSAGQDAASDRRLNVEESDAGLRADVFLARRMGISRKVARALVDEGVARIIRDGRPAPLRKGDLMRAGDEVTVGESPRLGPAVVKPEPQLAIPIVYADAQIVVVDKPGGLPTHPLIPGETRTAASAVAAIFPEVAGVGGRLEGGACHRLDTGTSGLVVFARTDEAYRQLRELFSAGRIEKRYVALCAGDLPAEGKIDHPIAHTKGAPRARACPQSDRVPADALPARTDFRALERGAGFTLVECRARTGRMHQIRVHLSAIGHPLAGDEMYGGPPVAELTRPFLHASELILPRLTLEGAPRNPLHVRTPLPADLALALALIWGS